MGIHGIYKEIGPGQRIALSKLAVQKFEATGRPLRIAIDVSIWLFQIQASKGGTNPAPRTFYYRLLRLIQNSIHPVFVFDGPNKPPFKRGKRTGANVSSVPDFMAKQLIKQFGFPIHYAPGEAEAECALLQREGIVDAVLSEDVDTLMFGSGMTIRNWSPEPGTSGKTPSHVNVYDSAEVKSKAGLDREGMILIALMSGGDYVPEGIPGCGPKTACSAARAGFGHDLCNIRASDARALQEWRERLQHELKTNHSKFFRTKHPSMKIPDDFPRLDILGYYTHPVVSNKDSLDRLRRSIKWDQEIDFPGLRTFTHDAFDWIRLEGAKHFIRNLAPVVLTRALRTRGETVPFSENPDAVKEDEALWVKGIHGRREHAITDNTPELRVSYTPIELVKIDLSQEDPDDVISTQGLAAGSGAADADEDVDLEEDDEDGPRKRGPTKFDPTKPARTWVMETFVKVGVPVTVEDWEAAQRNPKPKKRAAAAARDPSEPAKPRATRKTKTAAEPPQPSIAQFAKVTKPRARAAQPRKTSEPPSTSIINLLSSSPVKPTQNVRPPRREPSLSPLPELPPSVTKRRRRAPIQRAQTLPASPLAPTARPSTQPFDMSNVETLDLAISSPVHASPSVGPVKKVRTGACKNAPVPRQRARREKSVTASPSKVRQTTLEVWVTPSKLRIQPSFAKEMGEAPLFPVEPKSNEGPGGRDSAQNEDDVGTLDLTMSSPFRTTRLGWTQQPHSGARPCTTVTNPRRRDNNMDEAHSPRPPLHLIPTNTSFTSTTSTTSTLIPESTATTRKQSRSRSRRPSPPVRQSSSTLSALYNPSELTASTSTSTTLNFSLTESIDLTSSPAKPSLHPSPRRSPRNHSSSPRPSVAASPVVPPSPAAWKAHAQKKKIIRLRESLAGSFEVRGADEESPERPRKGKGKGAAERLREKEKERRVWRMSQVEVLDLT